MRLPLDTLYHSSPVEIIKIDPFGRFGSYLFFSSDKDNHGKPGNINYKLEINMSDIIDSSKLGYIGKYEILKPHVQEVQEMSRYYGVELSEEEALDLIDETEDVFSHEKFDELDADIKSELSFDIQKETAHAAKSYGYKGVAVKDEHGTSYMIDMSDYTNQNNFSRI